MEGFVLFDDLDALYFVWIRPFLTIWMPCILYGWIRPFFLTMWVPCVLYGLMPFVMVLFCDGFVLLCGCCFRKGEILKTFSSVEDAASSLGVGKDQLLQCLHNDDGNTYLGSAWRFAEVPKRTFDTANGKPTQKRTEVCQIDMHTGLTICVVNHAPSSNGVKLGLG
jgi:hypothetical protein